MQIEEIRELFKKHQPEFGLFNKQEEVRHRRPDIHAMILLDHLVAAMPNKMIAAAEDDEVWFDVTLQDLERSEITEMDILSLVRSGVRIDEDIDCLSMFI